MTSDEFRNMLDMPITPAMKRTKRAVLLEQIKRFIVAMRDSATVMPNLFWFPYAPIDGGEITMRKCQACDGKGMIVEKLDVTTYQSVKPETVDGMAEWCEVCGRVGYREDHIPLE